MIRAMVSLCFLMISLQAHAVAFCELKWPMASGKTKVRRIRVTEAVDIYAFPDGKASADEGAVTNYVNAHRKPGKVYDYSEEGIKNIMEALDGTLIFTVVVDESGKNLLSTELYRYDRVKSPQSGAIPLRLRVNHDNRKRLSIIHSQTGAKLFCVAE